LLEELIGWGIGDGVKPKRMTNNWIHGTPPHLLHYRVELHDNQTIDSLISPRAKNWDSNLIHSYFDEDTTNKIFQVPISRHRGEDFISWPHT
jgi:hypothetical protein